MNYENWAARKLAGREGLIPVEVSMTSPKGTVYKAVRWKNPADVKRGDKALSPSKIVKAEADEAKFKGEKPSAPKQPRFGPLGEKLKAAPEAKAEASSTEYKDAVLAVRLAKVAEKHDPSLKGQPPSRPAWIAPSIWKVAVEAEAQRDKELAAKAAPEGLKPAVGEKLRDPVAALKRLEDKEKKHQPPADETQAERDVGRKEPLRANPGKDAPLPPPPEPAAKSADRTEPEKMQPHEVGHDTQGQLPKALMKHPVVQEYLKSGPPFGYLGHENRTPETDKMVYASLQKLGKDDKAIAEWMTSKNARHAMDGLDTKDQAGVDKMLATAMKWEGRKDKDAKLAARAAANRERNPIKRPNPNFRADAGKPDVAPAKKPYWGDER